MMTFREYLKQYKKKYVCLEFDEETNQTLRAYAKQNGFNISLDYNGNNISEADYKFHVTIFYTTSTHNTPNSKVQVNPFEICLNQLELLGENKDIPVIKLKNTGQIKRIRELFEMQGYRDVWPEYKPHISLSYERKKYDLQDLELPDFKIRVKSLHIEDQG